MKRTRKQLVGQLTSEGLSFSEFTLTHEGDYSISDADWNYKDVPHLHWVHKWVEAIIGYVGSEEIATINLQKVLGITFPMTVFNYQSGPHQQTYFTNLLVFTLIIETTAVGLATNRARVDTTYSVGSSKLWRWLHPLIHWTIKRNYKDLMSQDIPMRTRRGQLRSWGYSFLNNAPSYSFEETIDVSKTNVILPKQSFPFEPITISVEKEMPADTERFIGRDDHLGLRLVRAANKLSIFPRLCQHEGSSLDAKACTNNRVRCHWHGRLFGPLATLELGSSIAQDVAIEYHQLRLENNILSITIKDSAKIAAKAQ